MLSALAVGFVTSLSLIVAIGAQNAFVLRQGIRREHVLPVVLICALSDVLLITVGIAGLGVLITSHPVALEVARFGGAAFLIGYAVVAARRALRPGVLRPTTGAGGSLGAAVLACLSFTFLNPHVYLDTVVLLGALANQNGNPGRWFFGIGAVAASAGWFLSLGYGAGKLAPIFARPRAWQVLDGVIACVMVAVAVTLLFR